MTWYPELRLRMRSGGGDGSRTTLWRDEGGITSTRRYPSSRRSYLSVSSTPMVCLLSLVFPSPAHPSAATMTMPASLSSATSEDLLLGNAAPLSPNPANSPVEDPVAKNFSKTLGLDKGGRLVKGSGTLHLGDRRRSKF